MSLMRPVSSAIGMNSAGGTSPSVGWRQRTSASNPSTQPRSSAHDGLQQHLQLPVGEGVAEVVLELQAAGGAVPHRGVEGGDAVPSRLLGLVHGGVGVADHALGVEPCAAATEAGRVPSATETPMLAEE